MQLSDFDFDLPRELIAQRPADPREDARLLHVGAELMDYHVRDLPNLLRPDDLLVFNDTRVIPARLYGKRDQVRVEVTLHRQTENGNWRAFARPGKRLREGQEIMFGDNLSARVLHKLEEGEIELNFSRSGADFLAALESLGHMPLPPYIQRPEGSDARDHQDYQTAYAREPGAVAAPTAGLHFTDALLERISDRGVETAWVTLHVGAGTFLPVKVEKIEEHRMHLEYGRLSQHTASQVNRARAAGRRVVAVGTTALRLLETAASEDGKLQPFDGETGIFIYPGYRFRCVDALITNFHLPKSTLFMLVCAFAGTERMKAAYAHAVEQGYRFFSYGDSSLLERA
ncbi:tRNA preQ1(34) S-adenosylmethionine ribosyltransferase-isomerase QueA [Fodinicurvata fenggangensis]|uniref:tRNA preQ1(34) S-adenosylmethionine ribosyltransferase-isomerase QueA n=1 Tax=Fodinicurvata fenggangensis TaxID=1121830 RepID=UPI00047DC83E|nr:tRNA preQ1(34) S-adenosylmethionine ribosyltransferase-isomerase QueA [Fodinicurvata fenggangensis]